MPLSPGTRFGSYEVVAQLGAGGMGEVYRARDTKLGREVALKILPEAFAGDPDRLMRFEREARTLAALNHPHIAQVYGLEDGPSTRSGQAATRALVMELVGGEDLSTRIARGPFPLDEALPLARQISEALEAAHEAGIIHRDLKPANIKVRDDGTVKVLDFGLAKALDSGAMGATSATGAIGALDSPTITSPALTMRGVILGTAAYMAPEQAKGKPVDRRSDIWAFGCVLYEMLTGRRAFEGEDITDTIAAVVSKDPDWLRLPASTPANVRKVLRRCLEKDRRQRLADIADANWELTHGEASPAAPPAAAARGGRSRLPWAVALTASLVATAALWQREAPSPPRISSIEISYPDGVEAQQIPQSIAISPDGRTVGMIGMEDGMRTLFLRSVDEIVAAPLPQPVNPVAVVFSPDGSRIAAITSNGELWQVSPRDNAAQRIASDVDLSCGLSWSVRAIVFCRAGTLWTATPGGGERQLTTLESAREEVAHGDPVIVDDRLVLFTAVSGEIGDERIEAIPIEGGSRTIVVERAASPIVGASDRLLFVRDGALMTASFDAETRAIGPAAPVPPTLAESGVDWRFPAPVLSASGALLRSAPYAAVREVVVVDRQGAARPFGVPDGNFANPRLTSDGRRLLLEQRSGPLPRIFDMARGTATQLRAAAGAGPAAYATWNADGTRAVFRRSTMVWAATDGTGASQAVPHTRANDFPNSPGPDPDSVFVTRISPETGADVYLVSLSGAYPPRPLVRTRAFDGGGSLSPDGRWLLYQSSESGVNEIYLRPYPALDRVWQISEGGGVQARWNPSGKEIFYRDGAKMLAVSVDLSGAEPVRQKPVLLFDQAFASSTGTATPNYDVTPEGQFVVLRPRAGASRLILTTNWADALSTALEMGERRE